MKQKKLILTILVISLLAFICACGKKNDKPNENPEPTQNAEATTQPTESTVPTDAPVITETPTAAPTEEPTSIPTEEPTADPSEEVTPEPTDVVISTVTPAPTTEVMATSTPVPTATSTPKPTATSTPKPTATSTPKPTATSTPKPTATSTPKPTATSTPKPTATSTPKPTATSTPKPTPLPYNAIKAIEITTANCSQYFDIEWHLFEGSFVGDETNKIWVYYDVYQNLTPKNNLGKKMYVDCTFTLKMCNEGGTIVYDKSKDYCTYTAGNEDDLPINYHEKNIVFNGYEPTAKYSNYKYPGIIVGEASGFENREMNKPIILYDYYYNSDVVKSIVSAKGMLYIIE